MIGPVRFDLTGFLVKFMLFLCRPCCSWFRKVHGYLLLTGNNRQRWQVALASWLRTVEVYGVEWCQNEGEQRTLYFTYCTFYLMCYDWCVSASGLVPGQTFGSCRPDVVRGLQFGVRDPRVMPSMVLWCTVRPFTEQLLLKGIQSLH